MQLKLSSLPPRAMFSYQRMQNSSSGIAETVHSRMPHTSPAQQPGVSRRGPAGAMHVLIVEDDAPVRRVCAEMAGNFGCNVTTTDGLQAASEVIRTEAFDLVLLDLRLPGGSGLSLLQQLREQQPRAQIVVMTAYATVTTAVELMRSGVFDLLQKPFGLEQLSSVLDRVQQHRRWSAPSRDLQSRLQAGIGPGGMVGASPAMERIFRILSKVALTRHPVLIQGETGTGKELAARTIHGSGTEPFSPFLPVDCNALAPEFLDVELFGTAKDTSSDRVRPGALVAAGPGTVYLDEIHALAPPLQSKLLRALETRQAQPALGGAGVRFECRILASSSRDLLALVESGRFRKDLFYRLNIVNLRMPALRERSGDVPLLAVYFLERQRRELDRPFTFSEEAIVWMDAYPWAGNVRELENVVERVCALATGPVIHFDDLSTQLHAYAQSVAQSAAIAEPPPEPPVVETMEANERRIIQQAMQTFHGDKLLAAKALGIGKTTLYRKLKEYGMSEEAG